RATDGANVHSAYSAGRSLTIDTTAPTNVFSLTGVSVAGGFPVAFYPGAGSTIYYNGTAGIGARSFSIRSAVTDATSGPVSVTTPAAGAYNASGWTGTLTGSAADAGAGVDTVKLSIRDVTAGGSSCWNGGAAFDQPCPNFVAASGTTAWSYALAAGSLTDGHTHATTVETIDKIG